MAINKVINSAAKSHGAMSNVIAYVLRSDKVTEGFVDVTGPYSPDEIDREGVYRSFLNEKKQWGKDSGRMYSHNVISFHKNERITPAQCLEIGRKFVNRFFGGFQSLRTKTTCTAISLRTPFHSSTAINCIRPGTTWKNRRRIQMSSAGIGALVLRKRAGILTDHGSRKGRSPPGGKINTIF